MNMQYKAMVIGVSAGGLDALSTILPELPADFPIPVLVVQHLHHASDNFLAIHLDNLSKIKVKEAEEGEKIRPGIAYIAPPGYHLLVEEDETLSLSVDEAVNYARPSIDVLFETAADVYATALIGVILTGANDDGSRGLKKIKDEGGLAIVQDPKTAYVEIMPLAALQMVEADHILPLKEIGPFLRRLLGTK